ncbi:hypothetical protein GCM10022261_07710 [Brevibacterium daeguense]|uniref:Cellulose biosynthesis protein BcsQ n=1 Tax=Brevibacterium daeguense TaxID=909936 RepID=A0ABP8EH25_9MICO|nr:hypothetical protein [Brevibacterium daeguense]
MTLISLASAKGAPGTTTLALLAAALWPRTSFLVDADIRGGDLAYRMPLEVGGPVDPDRGLMSLMPLARKELPPQVIAEHAQTLLGGTELIAGLFEPEQATAVQQLWPSIGRGFAQVTTHDVIADLGSLWASATHLPLAKESAALVFVMRPRPADVIHTRRRLAKLRSALPAATPRFGVVVVAEERDARDAEGAFAALGEDVHRHTEYLGHLALDPKGVGMFEGQVINRPERTVLVRSGLPIVERIAQLADIRIDRAEMVAAGAIPEQREPRRRRRPRRSGQPEDASAGEVGSRSSGTDRIESLLEPASSHQHQAQHQPQSIAQPQRFAEFPQPAVQQPAAAAHPGTVPQPPPAPPGPPMQAPATASAAGPAPSSRREMRGRQ